MRNSFTFREISRKAISVLTVLVLVLSINALVPLSASAAGAASSTTTTQTASSGNSLPSDSTQSGQASALGFSTEQPARLSPSGKEVDKRLNPLGSNTVTMNRIYQLSVSNGLSANVFDVPLGNGRMFSGNASLSTPAISLNWPIANAGTVFTSNKDAWIKAERATAAADVDGNGTQEVATAGYLPIGTDGKQVSLHLIVSDYSQGLVANKITAATSKDYTIVSSMPTVSDGTNYDQSLKITAGDYNHDGKDEIAVAAGSKLYLIKADTSAETLLSSTSIASGISDIETADSNGDGFQELLATCQPGLMTPAQLYIYSGTDLAKYAARINLSFTPATSTTVTGFINPCVTVGDALGDGSKTILIGGRISSVNNNVAIAYLRFDPTTETYPKAPAGGYILTENDYKDDYKAVKGTMDIKCVSLATPVSGTPQYVVLGGFIYQYDQSTDAFKRVDVSTYANTSGLKGNNSSNSHGGITDVNVSSDTTYILGTYVGNFDGNTLGQEQIITLHYNKWYDSEYVYVTSCGMNSSGVINASLTQLWKKDPLRNTYAYPSVCPTDIHNNGVRLEFESEKSTFMFSNPSVLAVLGATPYYSELTSGYGALGNVGTTYGTENESSSSASNGITANIGMSFGYTQGFGILGITIGEASFETTITNSFSYSWEKSKSISKSLSFTGYYSDDSVVLMVIPYDVYYYKVYSYDSSKNSTVESEMCVTVPYSPMTTIMPVTDYNKAAGSIKDAPVIGADVLDHTVGDPRTYPGTATGLTNVAKTDVLEGGTGSSESENFVAAGTGNNSVEQSITTSESKSKSFDYSLDVNVSFSIDLFGATSGRSASVGYTRNATTTATASTIRTGSVASVPSGYDRYNFKWCLVAYNYNLKAGDTTQECTVISYIVRPVSTFPPAIPANFKVKTQSLGSTVLQWDQASGASGYKIARATTKDGTYTNISGTLSGKAATSYTDTTASYGQTYYYQLVASAASDSIPADALQVKPLTVSGLTVKTQPKLTYSDGEALSLSALVATMRLSDGASQDVQYNSFTKQSLTTSLANGVALTASQTGIPITVTYTPAKLTVNTGNLTVNAKSLYVLTMSAVFKVGSTNNATALAPNTTLTAAITLGNNTTTAQDALVILALYNDKGTMVSYTNNYQSVAASGKASLSQQLALPSSVTGYTAKVMVWDGKDFSSTTLTPKAATAQISA